MLRSAHPPMRSADASGLLTAAAYWGGSSIPHAPRPVTLLSISLFAKPHLRGLADPIPAVPKDHVSVIVHLVQGLLNLALRKAEIARHHLCICGRNDPKVSEQRISHVILKLMPIAIATA